MRRRRSRVSVRVDPNILEPREQPLHEIAAAMAALRPPSTSAHDTDQETPCCICGGACEPRTRTYRSVGVRDFRRRLRPMTRSVRESPRDCPISQWPEPVQLGSAARVPLPERAFQCRRPVEGLDPVVQTAEAAARGRSRTAHAVVLDRQHGATIERRGPQHAVSAFAYLATFVGVSATTK